MLEAVTETDRRDKMDQADKMDHVRRRMKLIAWAAAGTREFADEEAGSIICKGSRWSASWRRSPGRRGHDQSNRVRARLRGG